MAFHKKAKSDGFTIIEVLIVLAIAGLIMLIVFAALPALSRSSRNNQRKQDAAAILSAVSHYGLNNGGAFPAAFPSDCQSQTNNTCYLFYTNKLGFYDLANVHVRSATTNTVSNNNVDSIDVYNHYICQDDGSASKTGAGYRDIVAIFGIEQGSGSGAAYCQKL